MTEHATQQQKFLHVVGSGRYHADLHLPNPNRSPPGSAPLPGLRVQLGASGGTFEGEQTFAIPSVGTGVSHSGQLNAVQAKLLLTPSTQHGFHFCPP